MPCCLVGLGSNLGNRHEFLDAAVARLAAHPQIGVLARSRWRETRPVGGPQGQSDFLNGAVKLDTSLPPRQLLAILQDIEVQAGRRRAPKASPERWEPRTLDLDLLLYDEWTLDAPDWTLPHPRMAWRRFVLESAAEAAGDMRHPTIGWSVLQLLEHLDTSRPYVAMTGPICAGKTQLAWRLADALGARRIVETPDWAQLGAFYADPAAHAWTVENHFLNQRAALLAADAPAWSPPRWAVSDFWFDQSAAFARAWLPPDRLAAYLERFEQLRPTVARPRLVVALDAPADELLFRVGHRGRACERPLGAAHLERIRRCVSEQTSRPNTGPVLRLPAEAEPTALSDVLAAVRGME
jgi:2-amino-4-hydroxy-6-hydroxymethyldihydropteridine diphosphokinase